MQHGDGQMMVKVKARVIIKMNEYFYLELCRRCCHKVTTAAP